MQVAFFSAKSFDRQFLEAANHRNQHELVFLEPQLDRHTAVLAAGCAAVCLFVNDKADAPTLDALAAHGTRLLGLRCAGYNTVDLKRAEELGLEVVRVPIYSLFAIAEQAVGLVLTPNRKLYRAYNRVREDNFSLEGLLGFDLHGGRDRYRQDRHGVRTGDAGFRLPVAGARRLSKCRVLRAGQRPLRDNARNVGTLWYHFASLPPLRTRPTT